MFPNARGPSGTASNPRHALQRVAELDFTLDYDSHWGINNRSLPPQRPRRKVKVATTAAQATRGGGTGDKLRSIDQLVQITSQ